MATRDCALSPFDSDAFGSQSSQIFNPYAKTWWVPGKCRYLTTTKNNGTRIGLHRAPGRRGSLSPPLPRRGADLGDKSERH